VADCPAGIIAMDDLPVITDEAACYRCQHCLAVCPEGAVSILGKNPDASVSLSGNLPSPSQVMTLITGRRAVRRYTDENLDPALLDGLLETACHAPTGVNAQDVLFTVVKDRAFMAGLRQEVLDRLANLKKTGGFPEGLAGRYLGGAVKAWNEAGKDIIFRGAPHMLVTSAPKDAPCPVQDAHIALATFELMASASGVGTLWDGMFMMVLGMFPDLRKRLGIPEDHTIGYAMLFGAPAVEYHRTVQRGPARVNALG